MLYSIILTNTANEGYRQMTEKAVQSLIETYPSTVCVVETNQQAIPYSGCINVMGDAKFNYNKHLNYGYAHAPTDADYIGIFNNDVVFHPMWFDVALSKADSWDSFSPLSPNWMHHANVQEDSYGFGIGHEFTGWAVVMKRWLADKLFPLDEQFEFWCQDNDMAEQIKRVGGRHLLIHDSRVTHLFSKSHGLIEDMNHATAGMVDRFNKKYK